MTEPPTRTAGVKGYVEAGGQDEEKVQNWIRQVAAQCDIVLPDSSLLSQLEGRPHKRIGIPYALWSHVPLPTESSSCIPLIWIARDVPIPYCQATVKHFTENSYAPLLLSMHYEDMETGWFPMPPNTPKALEKALGLAELRHMEIVIIRASSRDIDLSQEATIPDVVLSAGTRNEQLWAAMEQENNMWISSLNGTEEEVSRAIYNALTNP